MLYSSHWIRTGAEICGRGKTNIIGTTANKRGPQRFFYICYTRCFEVLKHCKIKCRISMYTKPPTCTETASILYLPTYLSTYLPTSPYPTLPTYLPTYSPTYMNVFSRVHKKHTLCKVVVCPLFPDFEFFSKGARMVRELFEMARTKKACIIFFDEIDAIGGT